MRVIWVLLLAAGLTVLPRVSAHAVPREMMRLTICARFAARMRGRNGATR